MTAGGITSGGMTRSGVFRAESGGAGSPLVVLIHGSMDRSAGMLRLSRRLDDTFRVLRYDRRGYGRSTPHPGPFTVSSAVDDLAPLLDGRRAVLFGHSYGGNVALAAAARLGDQVMAAIIYEAPTPWEPWWPDHTAGSAALGTGDDPAEAAERFMRRLIGDARWERLPTPTRLARRAEGVAMVGELADLRRRRPWDPTAVGCPVMVVHGELAAAHHRRASSEVSALFGADTPAVVEGARHFGPNTHPDAVAQLVTEHARGAGVSRAG